jgi:hypothetical protein
MQETIFNFIDSVLFSKKKLNTLNEDETQFNLYMLNRWCSMYSTDLAKVINETTNKKTESFSLKQDQYNYCFNIFPKVKFKKIEYLKKNKTQKEDLDLTSEYISKSFEISKREAEQYIDFLESLHN